MSDFKRDKPICVLAGNYRQYMNWCRDCGLHPQREARYCSGFESVAGMEFEEFTRVGTWWRAPEINVQAFEQARLTRRVKADVKAGRPITYVRIT